MARTLIAFLPTPGQEDMQIAVLNKGEWVITPAEDVRISKDDEMIALAPGTDVAIKSIDLSIRKEAEARRAALYAIEDEVAASVSSLHVAISGMNEAGKRERAIVCDAALMASWIEQLEAIGHASTPIYADLDCLPDAPCAVDLDDRVLVRTVEDVYAIDRELPEEALTALLPADDYEVYGAALAARVNRPARSDIAPHAAMAKWAAATTTALNLRQGTFAAKRASSFDINSLRWPALIGAAACVLWATTTGLQVRALNGQTEALTASARQTYQAANPGAPVPRNLLQAVSQDREAVKPTLSFLDATADLYSALDRLETSAIRTLRYNRASGRLQAALTYGAYGDELKVKTDLEARGYKISLGDTRQANGQVIGDITLEPAS